MLNRLIKALKHLPAVGEKTAARYAYALLDMDETDALEIARAIDDLKHRVSTCEKCNNITDGADICFICADPRRDLKKILVIENISILRTIENTGEYNGTYYIIPKQLRLLYGSSEIDYGPLQPFLDRVLKSDINEIIVATNPTIEGDTVGIFLSELLEPHNVKVSRIAYGIPVGIDLGYIDDTTLIKSLEGRREIK